METKMAPNLISGFLLSIINLGKELADEDIQIIKFHNLKILFKKNIGFVIALAINDRAPKREAEALLGLIHDEFDKRYSDILSDWNGDESTFQDFDPYIMDLAKKNSLEIELFKTQTNEILKKGNKKPILSVDWDNFRNTFKIWEKSLTGEKEKDGMTIKLKDGSRVSLFNKISEKMNEMSKKDKDKRDQKSFSIQT